MHTMESPIALKEKDYGYIFDRENPRSLINITPTVVSNYIKSIPREYLEADMDKLEEEINPTRTDKAVKILFWREYNKAQLTNTPMQTQGLWRGVCQEMHLYKNILSNTKKLAWILTPKVEDEIQLHLLYDIGLQRVEEILCSDFRTATGLIDPKRADLVLKAFAMIENRVKGMATQRIEKKSLSVKVEETVNDENREKKIQLLKERLGKFNES